jgi:hypothetical protein
MGTTNFSDVAADTATFGQITATSPGISSSQAGVTAAAGGGQANATAITKKINSVDTVATAADSVKLPLAQIGLEIFLTNNTATSMQVFGSGTDTINIGAGDVATATGVAQAANKTATYVCTKSAPAGKWQRVLTA